MCNPLHPKTATKQRLNKLNHGAWTAMSENWETFQIGVVLVSNSVIRCVRNSCDMCSVLQSGAVVTYSPYHLSGFEKC